MKVILGKGFKNYKEWAMSHLLLSGKKVNKELQDTKYGKKFNRLRKRWPEVMRRNLEEPLKNSLIEFRD